MSDENDILSRLRETEKRLIETSKKLEGTHIELEAHEGLLRFAMDDMRRIYEDLMKAQAQLLQADKLATIGLLTAGIIHEINTPLMASQGFLTLLNEDISRVEKKFDSETVREMFQHCLDALKKISYIVNHIKTFSRSDKGVMGLEDVNKVIESVITLVWNQIKYRMELRREYGQVPRVNCNAQQLGQVFLNLLVNATQAIKDKGVITLRTYSKDGFVCAEVRDTCAGIPNEILPKIFEPFFTTKEAGEGTGLGLSISYDIIKKHHGNIEVESETGKGTVFKVSLPISDQKSGS